MKSKILVLSRIGDTYYTNSIFICTVTRVSIGGSAAGERAKVDGSDM